MTGPPDRFRLLAWNILHGGGPVRTPEIGLAVCEQQPDLVVLSEFRVARGGQLRAQLADAGLVHQFACPAPPAKNTILIAARARLAPAVSAAPTGPAGRLCSVHLPDLNLGVCGVHVPDASDPTGQRACLQHLVGFARTNRSAPCVIVGDFNLGRWPMDIPEPSACESMLGNIASLGFVDAWRMLHPHERQATWTGPWGGPGRLDTAYLSAPLRDAIIDARYLHRLRDAGLSDHSALLVDWTHRAESAAPSGDPRGPGLFPR